MTYLTRSAPAKINRCLRITAKREDGYHELVTVFDELDWGDTVHASRGAPGVRLQVRSHGPRTEVPVDEGNLMVRAASAWCEATAVPWGVDLVLDKRVPTGAGLGGGSSDAAATLRLLQELAAADSTPEPSSARALGRESSRAPPDPSHLDRVDQAGGDPAAAEHAAADQGLTEGQLFRIASALGADVPFFLSGGTQLGRGTGIELTPVVGAPRVAVLLIVPEFPCDTRLVYENFRPQWIEALPPGSVPSANPVPFNVLAVLKHPRNDLQRAAHAAYPELARLYDALVTSTGRTDVCLSGSGSTCFIADADGEELRRLGDRIARQVPGVALVHAGCGGMDGGRIDGAPLGLQGGNPQGCNPPGQPQPGDPQSGEASTLRRGKP